MNKIVRNFFICLFVLALCSCAKKQTQPVTRGSFAPGVFIKNRLDEAENFFNSMNNGPDKGVDADKESTQIIAENNIAETTEQKNVQKIPGTSMVRISTGDNKKRKYMVVE